jgi:hypothetical protein
MLVRHTTMLLGRSDTEPGLWTVCPAELHPADDPRASEKAWPPVELGTVR